MGSVLIAFLIILSVSAAVGIFNKVKEGRYIGQDVEVKNTITVTGTGEVYAKPDLAIVSFTVKTEAKSVAEAMEENTEKMNAVIGFMKAEGIEEKDLKTTNFNIYPRYEYYEKEDIEMWPRPEGQRVLVGYEITQSLQIKIREMESVGDIIQLATGAGANQVGSLNFTIDDQDELKNQAREEAIKEAKEKAQELASQLGIKLIRIQSFSESGGYPYYDYIRSEAVGMGGEAPKIETGENKIEVSVTLTYEIN